MRRWLLIPMSFMVMLIMGPSWYIHVWAHDEFHNDDICEKIHVVVLIGGPNVPYIWWGP